MVDLNGNVQAALAGNIPAGDELLPSADDTVQGPRYYLVDKRVDLSGENLTDAQPTFQNNEPVVSFRLEFGGGPQVRPYHPGQCRQALRHRSGRQGHLGPEHPGAHPRRLGRHLRQLHRAVGERSGDPAPGRRPAGAAHHRRGAHGRARPRRRFHPRRRHRQRAGGHPRDRLHAPLLRPLRPLRRRRPVREPLPDPGLAVAARRHAHAARHRRHRADHRHGRRFERADLRAHPRGDPQRQIGHRLDRFRLPRGAAHGHRRQRDDAHRRRGACSSSAPARSRASP